MLADESLTAVSGCDVQQGRWRSYYDGVVVRDSSAFDVDHLVPLAEAWDSGAKRWTAGTVVPSPTTSATPAAWSP